jgi:hypothetical protein
MLYFGFGDLECSTMGSPSYAFRLVVLMAIGYEARVSKKVGEAGELLC